MNPIYDQLVVEFYLSKGLVPFSSNTVYAGQVIGHVGNTSASGPHVQFEVRSSSKYFNL